MRIAGPDVVLFAIGLILFSGATYAISQTEGGLTGGGSALGIYNVEFTTADVELGSETVADFRQAEATFDVTQMNVTSLTFDIQCADVPVSAAAPFTLQVQVAGPNGAAPDPVSGACGSEVTVEVAIADAPPATTVQADTDDEARAALGELPNATSALGSWTVTVTGGRGATPLPIPAGNPGGSITLAAQVWEPRFTPVQR